MSIKYPEESIENTKVSDNMADGTEVHETPPTGNTKCWANIYLFIFVVVVFEKYNSV